MFFHSMTVKKQFSQAFWYMKMLTHMIADDESIFKLQGKILHVPRLSLTDHILQDLTVWYKLRQYVQLLGHNSVRQMEMIVAIILGAVVIFALLIALILLLTITFFPRLLSTSMALQAMLIIVFGASVQMAYLVSVFATGVQYNNLQTKHASLLLQRQFEFHVESANKPNRRRVAKQAISMITTIIENFKVSDEYFGLFGIRLDMAFVRTLLGLTVASGIALLLFLKA